MGADFSVVSRRRFMRLSLGAGSLLAMGGVTSVLVRGCAPWLGPLRILSDREHHTLTQLAHALLPRSDHFPVGAEDVDLATAFDTYLADEPPWNQRDLQRALFYLEWGPLILRRHARTFSNLPTAERLAFFRSWAEGDDLTRRQIATAFRRFLYVVFYDRPIVWPHIGYEGPRIRAAEAA